MEKYFLHGSLRARSGRGDALAEILLEAADLVSGAAGCRLYVISRDPASEQTVYVTEIWDSKEDHDRSLTDEHVRALISRAIPLLEGAPQKGQELVLVGGAGITG